MRRGKTVKISISNLLLLNKALSRLTKVCSLSLKKLFPSAQNDRGFTVVIKKTPRKYCGLMPFGPSFNSLGQI